MKYSIPLTNTLYLSNLNSYLILATDNIATFERQNDDFIKKIINKEAGPNLHEEGSHLNNIDWLFLNSLFVTMYASFEHFLMKVASTLEWQPKIDIKLHHMSGRGILEQYTNYLHLVGGLSTANREIHPWGRISHYQNVRNLLAHNGGVMMDSIDKPLTKHKDFKFLQQEQVVMAGSHGLIRIKSIKILNSFMSDTALLTNNLVKEFNKKYDVKDK